jgi:hypothetical protein
MPAAGVSGGFPTREAREHQRASLDRWGQTRDANRQIAQTAKRLRFVSRVPLICECDRPGCVALMMIPPETFASLEADLRVRLTAPGHTVEAATHGEKASGYWLHRLDNA